MCSSISAAASCPLSEVAEGGPPAPIVLRVKRKRTEDPADALVVTKVKKLDPLLCDEHKSVFHFVGTVSKENVTNKDVLEQIRSLKSEDHNHRWLFKHNPLAQLTISDRQELSRIHSKVSSANQRFKLVSKIRCCEEDTGPQPPQDLGENQHPVEELMSEMVHLYDIIQEESATLDDGITPIQDKKDAQCSGSSAAAAAEESVITCNSTRMIREKVAPKVKGRDTDYVYDLYFTQDKQEPANFDWASLSVHQPELVHDILDPDEEEVWEDEEDSNAEDNWRHDYPDEDEIYSDDSGLEDGHSNRHYRHRDACYDEYGFEDVEQHENYWNPRPDDESEFYGGGEMSN